MIKKNTPQSWNPPSVIIQYRFPVFPPSALQQKHKKCTKRHRYREQGRRPQTHRRRRPPPLKRYAGDVLAPVSLPEIKVIIILRFWQKKMLFYALWNDSNHSVSPSRLPLRVISRDFRSTRWERAPPPAASAPSHTLWSILTLRRAPWCLWLLPRPSSPSEGRHGVNYLLHWLIVMRRLLPQEQLSQFTCWRDSMLKPASSDHQHAYSVSQDA